jgi:hypothetical protein
MPFANQQIIDNDLEPSLQGVKMSRQIKDIDMWKMNLHFCNF